MAKLEELTWGQLNQPELVRKTCDQIGLQALRDELTYSEKHDASATNIFVGHYRAVLQQQITRLEQEAKR